MVKAPANPAPDHDHPRFIVEAMAFELEGLRDAERDKERKSAYQAAIDRLHGLAYRLAQPKPKTVGLPKRTQPEPQPEPGPPPPPAPPQRALPLGPVVVARKPKPRRQ